MSPEEVRRALDRPGLRRLWPEARERVERLGGVRGTVLLAAATEDERRAVADLLGLTRLPEGDPRVPLGRLDRVLRASRLGVGLEGALEALGGPLRNRPGERDRERRRWQDLWESAAAHPALTAWPGLDGWLEELRASGLLRRLSSRGPGGEEQLLEGALSVLAHLKGAAEVSLPVLAAGLLGSSHALDPGRPVGTLVLRALTRLAHRPPPGSAAERRDLWEWAGVQADDLSCDVLALGLWPEGGGAVGEGLRAFASGGEPVRITLRQLGAPGLSFPASLRVHVCENPAVVSAAALEIPGKVPPLVCLGGYANHAGLTLLRRLAAVGADLLYHGDFDWAGLKIANRLLDTVSFRPWRFTARDYRAALAAGSGFPGLGETPAAARWDPDLAPAMAESGLAVEEEAVLSVLLEDLGRGCSMLAIL